MLYRGKANRLFWGCSRQYILHGIPHCISLKKEYNRSMKTIFQGRRIEWDDEKNEINIKKHGFSLATARLVFADPNRKKSSTKKSEPLFAFLIFLIILSSILSITNYDIFCRNNSIFLRQKQAVFI